MTESLIWWIVQFAIVFMDFLIMYFLAHALMKKFINIEWKHFGLAVMYTLIVAPIGYFDPHLFRIVGLLGFLIAVKIIINRAKLSDLVLIYMMSILLIGFIQVPIAGGVWLVESLIELYEPVAFLGTQILSTVVVYFTCQKLKWFKWFDALRANNVLKLIVFLTAIVILIPMAMINFEYSLTYFLLLTLGFVLASGVIVPLFIQLYKETTGIVIPKEARDHISNWWFETREETDPKVIRENFKQIVNQYGMDLPQYPNKESTQFKEATTKKED